MEGIWCDYPWSLGYDPVWEDTEQSNFDTLLALIRQG